MGSRHSRQRGFSLIEIAIVLVVVGLIISGGLLGLAPVLQNSKVSQTNAALDRVEQALTVYVIQNGCLPCPADPGELDNATAGQSRDTTTHYTTGCGAGVANTACTTANGDRTQGVVPWVSLGLAMLASGEVRAWLFLTLTASSCSAA